MARSKPLCQYKGKVKQVTRRDLDRFTLLVVVKEVYGIRRCKLNIKHIFGAINEHIQYFKKKVISKTNLLD